LRASGGYEQQRQPRFVDASHGNTFVDHFSSITFRPSGFFDS